VREMGKIELKLLGAIERSPVEIRWEIKKQPSELSKQFCSEVRERVSWPMFCYPDGDSAVIVLLDEHTSYVAVTVYRVPPRTVKKVLEEIKAIKAQA
jgi:hypothetical protein